MTPPLPGAVTGPPRLWLRLEGLAVLALAVLLWQRGGHSWLLFAVLFLALDLSFAAYLAGPRAGALGYNLAHSYVGPAAAAALALLTGHLPVVALLWAAHIGFDRARLRAQVPERLLRHAPRPDRAPGGRGGRVRAVRS